MFLAPAKIRNVGRNSRGALSSSTYALTCGITFITLSLVVSETRCGFFKVYAKKEKRTAAKTKSTRLPTYVGRPNNGAFAQYVTISYTCSTVH